MSETRPMLLISRTDEYDPPRPKFPRKKIKDTRSQEQKNRISDSLHRLTKQMSEKAKVSTTIDGFIPEKVLIIELNEDVYKFYIEIQKIDGFEYLSEITSQELSHIDRDDGKLQSRDIIYLMMTDQRALLQFESLWNKYDTDSNNPLPGFSKFKEIFAKIASVESWGYQQRYIDTFAEEYLLEQSRKSKSVIIEIELWYRSDEKKRESSENVVLKAITDLNGYLIDRSCIEQIHYHSLLVEIPIIDDSESIIYALEDIVVSDLIMYIRPTPSILPLEPRYTFKKRIDMPDVRKVEDKSPVIALFDGVPVEGHKVLDGRIVINDVLKIADKTPTSYRRHGTAMASVILHGDIRESGLEDIHSSNQILCIPVLERDEMDDSGMETFPSRSLLVNMMYKVLTELFHSQKHKDISIINMSLGHDIPYTRTISAWARLMDWFAYEHAVLVIVSAGNHLWYEIETSRIWDLDDDELQDETIRSLVNSQQNRRIRPPSEGVNVLSVGSSNMYDSSFRQERRYQPFQTTDLPATYTAIGSGPFLSIKPELLVPGGEAIYAARSGSKRTTMSLVDQNKTGILVASSSQAGDVDQFEYTCGTSNSAALATRYAGHIYYELFELLNMTDGSWLNSKANLVAALKAILVHSAQKKEIFEKLKRSLHLHKENEAKLMATILSGYGILENGVETRTTNRRLMLLGGSEFKGDQVHLYKIPVPELEEFCSVSMLTTTLAWNTQIDSSMRKYRMQKLELELKDSLGTRKYTDHRATKRGTIQHDVREVNDVWDKDIDIEITSKFADLSSSQSEIEGSVIPYTFVVSIEFTEEVAIEVHDYLQETILIRPTPIEA